nr:class I SAM-dependent methyltransferase [uncultured Methanoregula sp.]
MNVSIAKSLVTFPDNDSIYTFENDELKSLISNSFYLHYRSMKNKINLSQKQAYLLFINDEKIKINFVNTIEKELFKFQGKKILDVGCGKGGVALLCAMRGAVVSAFDNDKDEINIAILRAEQSNLRNINFFANDAERIPFQDNYFDLVIASSVLEHVHNLDAIIKEMTRVTKVGGICCISCPNPIFPREAHYKIFLIPYLTKNMQTFYLKIRGFDPTFFTSSVTYPYPSLKKISKLFHQNCMTVENNTLKQFETLISNPSLIQTPALKKIFHIIKKIHFSRIVITLITIFPIYPNFVLYARKQKS